MGIDSLNGTAFTNHSTNQVIIGKTEAQSLNKTVGDTINLYGQNFTIKGIFETGNFMTDNGIVMPLSTLQNLTNNQNKVSEVLVKVTDNANVTTVSNTITNAYPNQLTTSTAADSANRINQGLGFINTASWAISLLAIFIGAVGVINTMVMTVYERTREIGVLKAVGWKDSRILSMILGESVVLTLIAFVVGTVIAVTGVEVLLTLVPSVGSAITPSFSIYIFLRAFGIALIVGVIGGLYPAYRAIDYPQRRHCAMNNNENIIEIKDLKKGYDNGKIKALNGMNLEVKKGEFISIMGPSGSGKSSLLNMIGGLDIADEGSIKVAGINMMTTKNLNKFRSKEIGFVFQMHNLIPNLSVVENVEIPMYETNTSSKEMRKRALELLKSVNLGDKIDQKPTKLSGGQRQRVAIARALVNNPSIILADEPTGSLDSKTGEVILNLLKDLHKKENVTLVMVTHEPYVGNMAERIITVLDGKCLTDNKTTNSK